MDRRPTGQALLSFFAPDSPPENKKNYESLPFTDPAQGSVYSCSVLFCRDDHPQHSSCGDQPPTRSSARLQSVRPGSTGELDHCGLHRQRQQLCQRHLAPNDGGPGHLTIAVGASTTALCRDRRRWQMDEDPGPDTPYRPPTRIALSSPFGQYHNHIIIKSYNHRVCARGHLRPF